MLSALVLVALSLTIVACSGPEPAATATPEPLAATSTAEPPTSTATPDPPTATATATATAVPPMATGTATPVPPTPTRAPLPGLIPEGIIIEFVSKTEGCTVSGPTEVPPGEYTFVLVDKVEGRGFYVSYLLDGYTFQDVLDIQGRPGRHWPKPDWVEYAHAIDGGLDVARNELVRTYSLEEGDLMIYVGGTNPLGNWFCSPLTVTAAASD
jgi:hypothetical protein